MVQLHVVRQLGVEIGRSYNRYCEQVKRKSLSSFEKETLRSILWKALQVVINLRSWARREIIYWITNGFIKPQQKVKGIGKTILIMCDVLLEWRSITWLHHLCKSSMIWHAGHFQLHRLSSILEREFDLMRHLFRYRYGLKNNSKN